LTGKKIGETAAVSPEKFSALIYILYENGAFMDFRIFCCAVKGCIRQNIRPLPPP